MASEGAVFHDAALVDDGAAPTNDPPSSPDGAARSEGTLPGGSKLDLSLPESSAPQPSVPEPCAAESSAAGSSAAEPSPDSSVPEGDASEGDASEGDELERTPGSPSAG